jgi:UDP-N-acetylmuramate dehydrogenase
MTRGPVLADLTTLRVGGPVGSLIDAATEDEFIDAVRAADDSGTPLLILGGGSNVVCSDAGFAGVVVRDRRTEVSVQDDGACGGVTVTASAGAPWADVVSRAVDENWVGIEALAGIPGSVGTTPVQNVGAYGQEVSDVVASVRTWDRSEARLRRLARSDCRFAYRSSALKASMQITDPDGRVWRPTPRFVVLDVSFQMRMGTISAPVQYGQLADVLGIEVGERAPLAKVRDAVLALRRTKGMVLDPNDHDTWSAGSFFTNPILAAGAAAELPDDAPRYPGGDAAPTDAVKTSAAWLIERAGFGRGFALPGSRAALSTKHALAITNTGGASGDEVVALARHIRDGVRNAFGGALEPEPVLVGVEL